MLAARRQLSINGIDIRTPLLVPSFSSKAFPNIDKVIKTMEEFITEPILVSAYDIYHEEVSTPINYPRMVFLDSGGYEASKDWEFYEAYSTPQKPDKQKPDKWREEFHESVIDKWVTTVPTVLVSYDHPNQRLPIKEQVERAKRLFQNRDGFLTEILIKPETMNQRYVQVDSVIEQIDLLCEFDLIGFTEKELGKTILEIMVNIAKIRRALAETGEDCPIQIFGSLDTITSPLYFLSGADIFDGLTWLRFGYYKGNTIYLHTYGALELGINRHRDRVPPFLWSRNINYLEQLKLEMRNYLNEGEFNAFRANEDLFEQSYETLREELGEG